MGDFLTRKEFKEINTALIDALERRDAGVDEAVLNLRKENRELRKKLDEMTEAMDWHERVMTRYIDDIFSELLVLKLKALPDYENTLRQIYETLGHLDVWQENCTLDTRNPPKKL